MPVEFLPKDDRNLQGHLGPHFRAPGVGGGIDEVDVVGGDNEADDENGAQIMFLRPNLMMMMVIRLVLFGTHKEKFVATLSPGCLDMRCLGTKFHQFYAFTLSPDILQVFCIESALCDYCPSDNWLIPKSIHLCFMIVGAGHDPA